MNKLKYNITKEFLVKEYINNLKTIKEIANQLQQTDWVIRDRLIRYNIPIRTISQSLKLAYKLNKRQPIKLSKKSQENRNKKMSERTKGKNNPMFDVHLFGKNSGMFKDGRTLKQYKCKICNKKITFSSGFYGSGLCASCVHKGNHHTEKTKKKISLAFTGEKHPNWQGGKSFEKYPIEFNQELKEKIRKRDHYTCQKCGITEEEHIIVYGIKLAVHHIDYDKNQCKETNLLTLCNECNIRVNFNRDYWIKYFKTFIATLQP